MATQYLWNLFVSAAVVVAFRLLFRLYDVVVAQPRKQRSALRRQGLSGPPPAFLLGNILEMKRARDAAAKATPAPGPPAAHNCGATLLPFFDEWRKQYGTIRICFLSSEITNGSSLLAYCLLLTILKSRIEVKHLHVWQGKYSFSPWAARRSCT